MEALSSVVVAPNCARKQVTICATLNATVAIGVLSLQTLAAELQGVEQLRNARLLEEFRVVEEVASVSMSQSGFQMPKEQHGVVHVAIRWNMRNEDKTIVRRGY